MLKIEYKMHGVPTVPPQSFITQWPLLQGYVLILLSLHEADIRLRLWQTRNGLEVFSVEDLFTYSGTIPWLPCARLSAKHGQHSPFPLGRSSGVKTFTGLPNPKASVLISFRSMYYYYIIFSALRCVICWIIMKLLDPWLLSGRPRECSHPEAMKKK